MSCNFSQDVDQLKLCICNISIIFSNIFKKEKSSNDSSNFHYSKLDVQRTRTLNYTTHKPER